MPYNFDFNKLLNVKTVEVEAEGWITPLYVEYGFSPFSEVSMACNWRVKGTQHTFVIPLTRLDFISKGNYAQHFKEVLEQFREDYIDWKNKGFSEKWMQEYKQQYSSYIIT
mgnify:CR=1 FL=1